MPFCLSTGIAYYISDIGAAEYSWQLKVYVLNTICIQLTLCVKQNGTAQDEHNPSKFLFHNLAEPSTHGTELQLFLNQDVLHTRDYIFPSTSRAALSMRVVSRHDHFSCWLHSHRRHFLQHKPSKPNYDTVLSINWWAHSNNKKLKATVSWLRIAFDHYFATALSWCAMYPICTISNTALQFFIQIIQFHVQILHDVFRYQY